MFNLHMFITPGQPFPQKQIEENIGIHKLENEYGFTSEEIDAGIEGELIRDQYLIEPTPKFMQDIINSRDEGDCMSDSSTAVLKIWISGSPESNATKSAVMEEIGSLLGIKPCTVKCTIKNALKKLREAGKDRELLGFLTDYYEALRVKGVRE